MGLKSHFLGILVLAICHWKVGKLVRHLEHDSKDEEVKYIQRNAQIFWSEGTDLWKTHYGKIVRLDMPYQTF